MSDDLVKRLRARQSPIGLTRTFPSEDERHMVAEMQYGPDPLSQEAADRIAALEAELREAREVLTAVVFEASCVEYANERESIGTFRMALDRARAFLAKVQP